MILKFAKCGILITICFFMIITNFAVHSAIVTDTTFKGFNDFIFKTILRYIQIIETDDDDGCCTFPKSMTI